MNPILHHPTEDLPTHFGLPQIAPPEGLGEAKAVDVLAAYDLAMAVCNDDITDTGEVADVFETLREARAAVAEMQRLVLAIDAECGNSKPDFAKVCALASEAAAVSRIGGAK